MIEYEYKYAYNVISKTLTFLSAFVGLPSILSRPSNILLYKGFFLELDSSAGRYVRTAFPIFVEVKMEHNFNLR